MSYYTLSHNYIYGAVCFVGEWEGTDSSQQSQETDYFNNVLRVEDLVCEGLEKEVFTSTVHTAYKNPIHKIYHVLPYVYEWLKASP